MRLPFIIMGLVWLALCQPETAMAQKPKTQPRAADRPTTATTQTSPALARIEPASKATVATTSATTPKTALGEPQKIEALLAFVKHSNYIFIRGGTEYSSVKAAVHLRLKWSNAGGRIKTARQFVLYLATKSSMTGKPYLIKKPDGTTIPSRQWLLEELDRIEKQP